MDSDCLLRHLVIAMKHIKALGILSCGVLAFAALQPALAQTSTATMQGIDLSGNWSAVNSTDANMDMPGAEPGPVDYLGVPLNAASRQAAEIFSLDQLAEPELQCAYYSQVYTMLGPFGLRIYTVVEPLDGGTIAWVVGGWDDKRQMFIWMDGRPHPSNIAPHEMVASPPGSGKTMCWSLIRRICVRASCGVMEPH